MTIIEQRHTSKILSSIFNLCQLNKKLELMQFATTQFMIYGEEVLETFAQVILGMAAEENQMETHTSIQFLVANSQLFSPFLLHMAGWKLERNSQKEIGYGPQSG